MSGRNATVTFARLVDRQIAEAFLPSCIQRVPNKSKLVELLPPRLRQSFRVFALALPIHPRTEAKAIFFMALRNATMTFALLVDRQIAEAFLPVRFWSVPNKSKLVELLSPRLRQNLRSLAPIAYPLPEGKAIFFMSARNATMTLALLVDRQIAEAFLPVRFWSVPNKSKLVELLSPRLRQNFRSLAPIAYPLPEGKAIFFMSARNATMTLAFLVDRQIAEAFLPVRFGSVPNKSKLVELLSPRLRQNLRSLAPIAYPLPEGKAIFFMSARNATMTLALLVDRQIAEAFIPIRFMRVPNKSKLVELLSPSLRQSFLVFAPALPNYPLPKAKAIFFMSGRNATMTFARLVDRQIAEAFRPVRFKRVPNKSKLVQLLSAWCR